jgi:hypothetical protein
LRFETGGGLWGRPASVGAGRLPEYIELGGDLSAIYVYVANDHDGSMAVTAAHGSAYRPIHASSSPADTFPVDHASD